MALTAAQVADLIEQHGYATLEDFNADKRTHRPIRLWELNGGLLYPEGLLLREPDGSVSGVLGDAMKAGATLPGTQTPVDPDLQQGLKKFLAGVLDPMIENLDTVKVEIAARTYAVLAGCQAAGLVEARHVAAVYALGGGLVIPEPADPALWDAAQTLLALRAAQRDAIAAADQAVADFNARRNAYVHLVEQAPDVASIPPIEEL